jgi:thiosulfate/3-mercaptopyruvate sulfurtransferase
MNYNTLISADELAARIGDPEWVIFDCRFSLADTSRGSEAYGKEHIPGAIYAHLDKDLSGQVIKGQTGRHPLPPVDKFSKTLSNWGIDNKCQVIVYDDLFGAIASRLWWMLVWLGHESVAVLDGGWTDWVRKGYHTEATVQGREYRTFQPNVRDILTVTTSDIEALRPSQEDLLIDAREGKRYRGEVEPIDRVAGHIPGAISVPYSGNLDAEGYFLSAADLEKRYLEAAHGVPTEKIVCYCGSGVTAAHNLLAMVHGGLGLGRLYIGSWSEWIADESRPISVGLE